MKRYEIEVNGQVYQVSLKELPADTPMPAPAPKPDASPAKAPTPAPTAGGTAVNAPLAGTVLAIKVTEGQAVKQGEILLVLEAMKMENEIVAPADGVVQAIQVAVGQSVESDQLLLKL